MPQMDFTTYAPQLVWLVISFVLLYLLMARMALPRIERILTTRDNRISGDLNEAAEFGRKAEAAQKAFDKVTSETRARAQKLAAEARERANAEQSARTAKLDAELAEQSKKADAGIAAARQKAMASLRDVAIDVAQAAAERVTGTSISKDAAAKAIDAEIKGAKS
ncbi:MAG: F0F1 ATP synthase subunit B' [Alphaproteobacteria bacterium]|nr:F0F1 ATP synthase subunit B' [Alphaproteobacteria bacterium]